MVEADVEALDLTDEIRHSSKRTIRNGRPNLSQSRSPKLTKRNRRSDSGCPSDDPSVDLDEHQVTFLVDLVGVIK
jgi:hypothetical protein